MRRGGGKLWAGLGLGLLAAASASALQSAPAQAPQGPVREAVFQKMPADYADQGPSGPFYPAQAYRSGITGEAIIQCTLLANGSLKDCKEVSEKPSRSAFGAASVAMARRAAILAPPRLVDGQAVTSEVVQVHVPFVFTRKASAF